MGPAGGSIDWAEWVREQSHGRHRDVWRGVMCVLRWLQIREENQIPPPGRFDMLEDDVSHSRLLRRLIDGREPLPAPPPESFGDPWYELIEGGSAWNVEVREVPWGRHRYVMVNQAVWRVVGEGDAGRLIRYQDRPDVFLLSRGPDGLWSVSRAEG